MKAVLSKIWLAVLIVGLASPLAFGQTSKAGLTGLVKDAQGGGIPGATVVVKNVATGTTTTVQTNGSGNWAAPSLESGQYTVTVSLSSFKTVSYDKVGLTAGQQTNINTVLEVGGVTDVIKVTATTQLVETSNTNVTTTVSADQMNNLPQVTKNALQFVTFLPGVNTGNSHVQRSSTIMGLPPSALAITLDGINVMDQYLKDSGGSSFFATIRPQTDLIEEVTVSEATPGADSSSGGAVQIKFVTRSGSNQPNGSAYEYMRHPALATNAFTNTAAFGSSLVDSPKNQIIVNQFGFRQGGPIVIPGLYDGHGKAFYFFNYEEFRLPSNATRTRQVLAPAAQAGNFQYGCSSTTLTCSSGANGEFNLYTLAGKYAALNPVGSLNGVASINLGPAITAANVPDPQIAIMLGGINGVTGVQDFVTSGETQQPAVGTLKFNPDRNRIDYTFQPGALRAEHIPGGRVDFNLTSKERLSGTYQFQKVNSNPDLLNNNDPRFPGFPNHGAQYSFRNSGSATLRSTLTANMVNEASWGFLWSPTYFGGDIDATQFDLSGGFATNLGNGYVTSPTTSANPSGRNGSNYNIRDTVSWLKGKHSTSFGFNYSKVSANLFNFNVTPGVTTSVDTGLDPIASIGNAGMFTTQFFPGATSTELGSARAMYALLTGRVTSISGTSRVNPDGSTYSYEGPGAESFYQKEAGLFFQDQWHLKSNLTLNLGLRYELQFPLAEATAVHAVNTFQDFCGQVGQGAINPLATTAANLGLNCQFGIPGYAPGVTPYTWTGTETGVTVPNSAIGTSKCQAFGSNTPSAAAFSVNAPSPCPTYSKDVANTGGWHTDWNNLGPSLGMAWQPNVQSGVGRKILGDPALATVRASYSRSFNVVGIGTLAPIFQNAPGLTFNSTRNALNGNLCSGADATAGGGGVNCFPLQYTSALNAGVIGQPAACTSTQPANGCVPSTLQFPQAIAGFTGVGSWIFNPNYQTSYSDSFSVGLQRAITRDMSIEVRYIRTLNHGGDTYREFGEQNIFTAPFGSSKNFLDEFQKAQANLAINVAAGKGATFAPTSNGAGGFLPGQQALPMFLASYAGTTGCGTPSAAYGYGGSNATAFCPGANDATKYTSAQWTNTANLQALSLLRPNADQFSRNGNSTVNDLFWNPTFRANGIAAGMPINFWVANPDAANNGVEDAFVYTKYDSVQVIMNRRLSKGLQVSANYAYQIQYSSSFQSLWKVSELVRSSSSPPNAFKLLINYDVPVGKGKRFGTNMNSVLDGIIGNWQLNMTTRVENGALVDIGNVQLKNMSLGDVQKAFHYYRNDKPIVITNWSNAANAWVPFTTTPDNRWYDLPLDIAINSQRAFSVDPKQTNGFTPCANAASTICHGADPNSRHFEPASTLTVDGSGNVAGCSAIYITDCGIRQQFITAPIFSRFEFSAKKRFPFARRGSFDVEIDALNLFNSINFNNNFSNNNTNVVNSAYADISNTYDPGGRLIQLVFRVNW